LATDWQFLSLLWEIFFEQFSDLGFFDSLIGQFLANKVGCMKNFRVVIVGITLLLFVGGILLSTLALEITQTVSGKQLFFIRVESEFYLRASLGFLLAFCSICASGFYWMCTKIFSKGTPTFLYIVSLFMSLISAVFGIWIKLLIIKFAFQPLPISYDYGIDESLAIEFIDYFSWGAGYVISTNLILASLIWLFSYQKKKTINNTLAT
jgi:hypothetical protein